MTLLVADCPRCRAKDMTFDVTADHLIEVHHGWQHWFETFCVCRKCKRATIYVLAQDPDSGQQTKKQIQNRGLLWIEDSLNSDLRIQGFINISDMGTGESPKHLPPDVEASYGEAAKCLSIGSWNASAAMFRRCIDLSTRSMLPNEEEEAKGLNAKTRRDLGLRLPWLFDNQILPEDLRELATCVHQDGNDGAHAGVGKAEAEDLLDFTGALLERIFTEPERLRMAKERRLARRAD